MIAALSELEVVTLFVEDLAATRAFYQHVFGCAIAYEDDVSAVLQFNNILVNLLDASNAGMLVDPQVVSPPEAGTRMLFTIRVRDVDTVCGELRQHGVKLLNGPVDRPWGRRTAAFADPAGNVWEVAHNLTS